MTRNRKATTDAVEIMNRRYFEGKPERLAALEAARANDEAARKTGPGLVWILAPSIPSV